MSEGRGVGGGTEMCVEGDVSVCPHKRADHEKGSG